MKHIMNKTLSILLTFAMVTALFTGINTTTVKADEESDIYYYIEICDRYLSVGDSVTFTPTVYDSDGVEYDITDGRFTFEWYTYDSVNGYSDVICTDVEYTIESITQTDFYIEDNNYKFYVCKLYVAGEYKNQTVFGILDESDTYTMYISGENNTVVGDTVTYTVIMYDYAGNEVDITDEKFTFEWYTYDDETGYSDILGTDFEYTIESISQTDFYTEDNNYIYYVCILYVNGEKKNEEGVYLFDKANTYYTDSDTVYAIEGGSVTFKPTVYDYDYNKLNIMNEKFTFEWYTYDNETGYSDVLGTDAWYTIESVSETDAYTESNNYKIYVCNVYVNGSYVNTAYFYIHCITLDDTIALGETKTVTVGAGEYVYIEFTPEKDVTATFSSVSDGDPYGYLYAYEKGELNQVAYFDDGGAGNYYDFSLSYNYKGGVTYVFKLYGLSTVTCDITLLCSHTYKATVTAPTCTAKGYTTYTCSGCGDTYVSDYTAATGHTYKTTTTKATISKSGSIVKKCTVCGNVASKTTIAKIKSVTLSATSYTYNGKAKKPTVTVKDSNGKKISSSYYTVTYKNNKKVGKATVTIKFKGNYSGTVTKTFTIRPKATSISKLTAKSKGFTVKWKKQSTQVTGYQIQYATNSKFTKNKKTVTISKTSTVSNTISKLKAKKTYYVRVRTYKTVSGKKYYSSWSKVKTVKTKK